MKNKGIFSIILMIFLVLSTAGLAAAAGGGTTPNAKVTLTLNFDKDTVKVGDNVTLLITQSNTGNVNFTSVVLKLNLTPEGLVYLSDLLDPAPDKIPPNNYYTPGTSTWTMNGLKTTSGNGTGIKKLYITFRVPKELDGKTIKATASYDTIIQDPKKPTDPTFTTPASVSDTLTVQKTSTGTSNNTGTGTSTTKTNTTKKTELNNALKKVTSNTGVENLQNLNQAEQKSGYEVNNATTSGSSNDSRTIYAILGGLIIAILIGIGYFKGIR